MLCSLKFAYEAIFGKTFRQHGSRVLRADKASDTFITWTFLSTNFTSSTLVMLNNAVRSGGRSVGRRSQR